MKYSVSSRSYSLPLVAALVAPAATACGAEYTEDVPPNTPAAPPDAVQTPEAPPPAGAPPAADSQPVYTPAGSGGQWVYTETYGWVWMPYEQQYTYVSPAQDDAYAYVYYPAVGWEWIHAPWVIGIGPHPYWGPLGPARFVWYAHPWFRPRHVYYYHRPYYRRVYRGYRR